MSKLFGGSKSKSKSTSTSVQSSSSGNRAFETLNNTFGNTAGNNYNTASTQIADELKGGFQGYKDNNNFDFMRLLGLERTSSPYAGNGVFNSGAAMKALAQYNSNYQDQFYNNYLDKLFQQGSLGLQGGQLVSGAGNFSNSSGSSSGFSNSSSNSSPGFGGFLGGAVGTIATSDRRLKENIEQIGYLEDGLPLYSFTYTSDKSGTVYEGVMSDDVRVFKPEALGPKTADGFDTVDYRKVGDKV